MLGKSIVSCSPLHACAKSLEEWSSRIYTAPTSGGIWWILIHKVISGHQLKYALLCCTHICNLFIAAVFACRQPSFSRTWSEGIALDRNSLWNYSIFPRWSFTPALINDCFRTERSIDLFLFSWSLTDLHEYLIASTINESSRSSVFNYQLVA